MKKTLTTFLLLTFLICVQTFGQIKLTWKSIDIIDETTISVKVFAQNLGERQILWVRYGNYNYDLHEELNFSVEYDYIPLNTHIILPPSSVTIKTIFGGSIAMETPEYYFEPTGSESGQQWEILFYRLPKESGNVIVKVLGERKVVGDMPLAEQSRKAIIDKFLAEKDFKTFDYKEFYPKDYESIENEVKQTIFYFTSKNKVSNATGKVLFTIDKQGKTSFNSNLTSNSLNNYLKDKFANRTLNQTSKLGYNVSSQANFDVVYSNGKIKIKKENGRLIEVKSDLPDKVKKYIENKTDYSGNFKINYNLLFVNDNLTSNSFLNTKVFSSENLNLIFIGGLILIPLIIAVAK